MGGRSLGVRVVGVGVQAPGVVVFGRARRNHERAPLVSRGEDTGIPRRGLPRVVSKDVEAGRRDGGRQAAEQAERIEVDGDGAVREGALELDAPRLVIPDGGHEAIVEQAQAVLRDGRAQQRKVSRMVRR
jgi:hypothetical protein